MCKKYGVSVASEQSSLKFTKESRNILLSKSSLYLTLDLTIKPRAKSQKSIKSEIKTHTKKATDFSAAPPGG